MIADQVPAKRRASAMSIVVAGSPLGVLGGLALGGVVPQHPGWHAAFFVAAIPGLILAAILWLFVPDPRSDITKHKAEPGSALEGLRILLASPLAG